VSGPKVILLNDTSSFNHHGSNIVVEQIRRHCERQGLSLWHTVKSDVDWRTERHRKRLEESDIVLVNGEGMISNNRKLALTLAQSATFCRERGMRCFLINSVYQDNGKEMADLVRQFDLVFVRESRSLTELRNEGIDGEVVPDMVLSRPDLPPAARTGLMVTDSSCNAAAAQLHDFYTRTHGAELASLFRPIPPSQALRKFVARVIGKRAAKRWRLDWHRFGKLRNPLFDAAPLESVDDLLRRISNKSLIVTGRFHMVCMAMLARTPFIALPGNTHKIEGMLADAELTNRYRSSLPDGHDLLAWSNWCDDEVTRIEAYVQDARSRISRMFSRIAQVATAYLLSIDPLLDCCDLIML
jgi:hypothetical protein